MNGPINIGRVRQVHAEFQADLNRILETESHLAGEAARGFVELVHPGFQHRTHHLSRSTGYRVVKTSRGRVVKIRNPASYAGFIDGGTRKIRPTRFLKKATEFAFSRFDLRATQKLNLLSARFKRAR